MKDVRDDEFYVIAEALQVWGGIAMAQEHQLPVTQRAYTLRLSRAPGECAACHRDACDCWREALWTTHEAVNQGAKAFGDWLLTLRGGLCHTLVDMEVPAQGKKPARQPTHEERRDRRVLLALSWLSVEDERGAPKGKGLRVATGRDADDQRGRAVKAALRGILEKRGVVEKEIEAWLRDCGPSLEARIREDAVWVNRSACFDEAVARVGNTLTREEVWDFLEPFFGTRAAYFAGIGDGEEEDDAEEPAPQDEQAKDLVQKAGQWLSARFGTGKGADFGSMTTAYKKIGEWASVAQSGASGDATVEQLASYLDLPSESRNLDAVLKRIRGPGYKSATRNHLKTLAGKSKVAQEDLKQLKELAERDADKCMNNAGRKGRRPWADMILSDVEGACGFTYLQNDGPARHRQFSVMLDHAARRVSIAHSWIKRAEQRRRAFEEDAGKLDALRERAPQAVMWLDQFCADRSAATGASIEAGYRIRKRAVEGWSHVVKAWSRPSCRTEEDRISAAREVQADPEVEKFGDIQLFEALATDDAVCVWRDQNGNPDPSILIEYVAATTAEHNRKRFKVPAYRHPDALRHPVFCDFGNSRWSIRFAIHESVKLIKARSKGKGAKKDTNGLRNRHGLRMGLWNGQGVVELNLRWSSKRLTADLALDDAGETNAPDVTRADRLGRAASGAFGRAAIMNVFEEAQWNGRLQVPRAQLDRIATLLDKGRQDKATILQRRLRWLVSFSPRLRPSGPFIKYAASHGIEPNRRTGEYYPNAPANKGREGLAKLVLSRLPGLRVLSVDLGHRFAAACAVWEVLSPDTFRKEIHGLKVLGGGSDSDDTYLHVEKPGNDGKPRTVIYRRIGPDKLTGLDHPAPWARLDRQFLIKLQGEEVPARRAARQETDMVRGWEKDLGRVRDEATDPLPHRIDLLMSETVTMLRRALRRHGDRARIAFNLMKATGGGSENLDHAGRVELLTQTLALWYGLFSGRGWKDPWAAEEWRKRGLPEIAMPEEGDTSGAQRQARRKALEETLRPHAELLVHQDLSEWYRTWSTRWRQDDETWSSKNGILRAVKRWIAPRGLRPLATDDQAARDRKKMARSAARYVGGLSISRINTILGLYQLLKSFKMRPEPDDPRKNVPKKGDDDLENFNRRLLDMCDRLREQRVKQLASRIVEAALGIGRIKIPKGGKTPERPRKAVDAPCHAVVIESLTHYRPDELRTRRENRQLMQWSSAKVQKYLKEGCQLYGLHLCEVPANYTSRQCSRTGLPGVRCDDVPVKEFLTAPWWNKVISAARKKLESNGADAKDRFLVELADRLKELKSQAKPLPPTVRVPTQGGDLFVAAPPWKLLRSNKDAGLDSAMRRAIQADLNAAANIGLRALLDPDWPGRWWYVPCRAGTSEPILEKVKGSLSFQGVQNLPTDTGALPARGKDRPRKNTGKAPNEIENLWRDPSGDGLSTGQWRPSRAYWNDVHSRAVEMLRRRASLDS